MNQSYQRNQEVTSQRCSYIFQLSIQLLHAEADFQNNIFLARQWRNEWIFCFNESHFHWLEAGTAADDCGICADTKHVWKPFHIYVRRDSSRTTEKPLILFLSRKKGGGGRDIVEMGIEVLQVMWKRTKPGYEKRRWFWMLWMTWILQFFKKTETELVK